MSIKITSLSCLPLPLDLPKYDSKDEHCPNHGLHVQTVAKENVAKANREQLSRGHNYCKDDGTKLLYRVEDKELPSRAADGGDDVVVHTCRVDFEELYQDRNVT